MVTNQSGTYKERIKTRVDVWLAELVEEDHRHQTQVDTLHEENKNLHQSLLQARTTYMQRLDEVMQQKEVSLGQETKKLLVQFNQDKARFYNKVRVSRTENVVLKQGRYRLEELQKHIQILEEKVSKQEALRQNLLQDKSSIDAEYNAKTTEKQKILDTIKHLEGSEIPQRETKLKKKNQEIEQTRSQLSEFRDLLEKTEQEIVNARKKTKELPKRVQALEEKVVQLETIHQKVLKNADDVETRLKIKNTEKQELLNTIKKLEQAELPSRETKLKEIEKEILEQEAIQQQRLKEIDLINDQIKTKVNEQQKALDAVRYLKGIKLPQQESKLKRMTVGIERTQSELNQRRYLLAQADKKISTENNKVQELSKQKQTLDANISQQENQHQEVLKVIAAIETQIQTKATEKEKQLDTIKHLGKVELVQREAELKEIKDKILQQEVQRQGFFKEITLIETQIQTRTTEKQKLLDTIKHLEEIAIPQQETKLNEIMTETERYHIEIREQQGFLAKMEQAIPAAKEKIKEFQAKEVLLRKGYQEITIHQNRLNETRNRLEAEVNQKSINHDELARTTNQLEADISAQNNILDKARESVNQLTANIAQQEERYHGFIKETAVLKSQIQIRNAEKQRISDTIKQLTKKELFQRETTLKDIKEKTKELQDKQILLKKYYQEIVANQNKLNETRHRLVAEVNQKGVYHDELVRVTTQLEADISAQNNILDKARESVNQLTANIAQQEEHYQNLIKETAALKSQIQIRNAEKQRISDTIKQLTKKELLQRETMLKNIEEKINQQEVINQELPKQISLLESQKQVRLIKKQRLLDTIKHFTEDELPRRETQMKQTLTKNEHLQVDLQQRQDFLGQLTREISSENTKILELQKRNARFKKEFPEVETKQKRLLGRMVQMEMAVRHKEAQREELIKKSLQLETEIAGRAGATSKIEGSLLMLTEGISEKEGILKEINQFYSQEKREYMQVFLAKRWSAFFWVILLITMMLGAFSFILWQAFFRRFS